MYEGLKIANMYTLSETIAEELLSSVTYPWEVLPKIGEFIKKLGPTLSEEEYEYRGDDVWVAKDAVVFPSAYIHGPAIIGKGAEVRHCAFIRGNAIVGEGAVVVGITHLLVIKEELGTVCWCVGAFGRSLVTRIHASADVYLSVSFGR